jgi:hypothetical protein
MNRIPEPDLNINIVEVDNGEVQQQNAIEVHPIPDLNINLLLEVDNRDVQQQHIIEINPLPDLNINVVEGIEH